MCLPAHGALIVISCDKLNIKIQNVFSGTLKGSNSTIFLFQLSSQKGVDCQGEDLFPKRQRLSLKNRSLRTDHF